MIAVIWDAILKLAGAFRRDRPRPRDAARLRRSRNQKFAADDQDHHPGADMQLSEFDEIRRGPPQSTFCPREDPEKSRSPSPSPSRGRFPIVPVGDRWR